MNPKRSTNLDMLAVVAKGLKGLKERVVFVGGSTIELYDAGISWEAATWRTSSRFWTAVLTSRKR